MLETILAGARNGDSKGAINISHLSENPLQQSGKVFAESDIQANQINSCHNPGKKVYTVAEVAIMLDVHPNTVYKLVKQKAFISRKIGTDIRILKASFDSWLENQNG